jgi:hypothetical protein
MTICSTGPGVAVIDAVAEAEVPLTDAVIEMAPMSVPMVTCVDAAPDASVTAVVGDTLAVPLTVKLTVAPETADPAASATATPIVPADCPTAAELAGDVVIVTLEGGPICGAVGSEPPQPRPRPAAAASAAMRRWRE